MDAATKRLLETMRDRLAEQQEFIDKLQEGANPFGIVLQVLKDQKRAVVAVGRAVMEVHMPNFDVPVGSHVTVAGTGQILKIVPEMKSFGPTATVERLIDDELCEVKMHGAAVIVLRGAYAAGLKPLAGKDQVMLDNSITIVASVLPPLKGEDLQMSHSPVQWEDIGGLSAAKSALEETVLLPLQNKDLFAYYQQTPFKGALLYGPPGNGKTLLGKGLATRLGGDAGLFLSIKGPEVLDKFVGETERAIRDKFSAAHRYFAETGKPTVLFVDEAEALLSRRGGGNGQHHAMVQQTVVPTFLAEMNGLDDNAVFVVLATNKPEMLDEAVVRDGRIDRKIEVGRPTAEDAREVLAIHIGATPIGEEIEKPELVERVTGEIYQNDKLTKIVSSAMLAGIVQHAKASAIRRDITHKPERPTGLWSGDFLAAINRVVSENQNIAHAA